MGDSKNAELASTKAMNVLLELQKSVNTVLASLNELKSRIKAIEDQIMRDSEPKQDYLKETIDTVGKMLEENGGIPVSKTDIAVRMGLSDSTIYFRCEKLVETGKIKKFYGRDLAFEPAKSVFYSLPRSLFDLKTVENIENESARKIALALVQTPRLSENNLLSSGTLTQSELKKGITYLLNRGLIARKSESDDSIFYIIPQD